MQRFIALALAPVLLAAPAALAASTATTWQLAASGDRRGSTLPRYNFPPPSRGDRFARHGLNLRVGLKGWRKYHRVIKQAASTAGIDPYVLGAYVWLESEFDPRQDYRKGDMRAVGLGSVQAQDHRRYSVSQLMDPALNLRLTASEFRAKWHPRDMAGTIMDVWYPAWRKRVAAGHRIPVVKTPGVYVQAIANRYYALQELDRRFGRGG